MNGPPISPQSYQEMLAQEGCMVHATIAKLFQSLGSDAQPPNETQPALIRPVPLARLLASVPLVQVFLPCLTPSKAIAWLGLVYKWPRSDSPGETVDEPLAALLVLSGGQGGFLFVNADDPVPRQRFSLAHELGHFLLHSEHIRAEFGQGRILALEYSAPNQKPDANYSARERQANRFAAELLMPEGTVRAIFARAFPQGVDPKTTKLHLDRLHRVGWFLAQKLLVSPEAFHYRWSGLNLVPQFYSKKRPEVWP